MRLTDLDALRPSHDFSLHDTQRVIGLLDVKRISLTIFRGQPDEERTRLFGGLIAAQALVAASRTTLRRPHSLHAMFIASGTQKSVEYAVETMRDGGAFSSRRVVASQDGQVIFQMFVSFQESEDGLSHQDAVPRFADREDVELTAWGPHWKSAAKRANERFYRAPVEFFTSGWDPYENTEPSVARHIWTCAPCSLGDDIALHEAMFTYASDYCLLFSALQPHGIGRSDQRLQRASLDHTIWFHRPLRIDDWLLLAMSSPSASGGRGLSVSAVYDRDGRRVATVAQEALIRLR
jgi:acyl-CoA thioesterase II